MSGIKGFKSQEKRGTQDFVTVQDVGGGKNGLDTVQYATFRTTALAKTVSALYTGGELNGLKRIITITAHGARSTDSIRFYTGNNESFEASIKSVIDVDTIELESTLPNDPVIGDEVFIMRPIGVTVDKDGQTIVSSGPAIFIQDGMNTEVLEDSVTPANNKPFPVKITNLDGDVAINAGNVNLEVQLDHDSALPDSVQIGDGTEILGINAANEALTRDGDAITELVAIKALDFSTETTLALLNAKLNSLGQKASVDSAPFVLSTEQEAILEDIKTSNNLTATEAKQDNTIAELQNILAKIIAAPGTEAKQDDVITALGTLLTELALKADLTETQPVSLVGNSTEAKQDDILAKIIAAPATEAKQDDIIAALGLANTPKEIVDFLDAGLFDASSTAIPVAGIQIVASLADDVTSLEIFEDIGEYLAITNGADAILAYLPLGGGNVTISIASGTELKLKSLTGSSITSGNFAINFIK